MRPPSGNDCIDPNGVRQWMRYNLGYMDCEVVAANCRRWDPSRLAFLDVIIIQVAMAEMLNFPRIPLKVSINEYVELAKLLSTPASGSFVNGMLDTIV